MSLIRGIRSGIFVNLDNLDKDQQGQQVAEEKPKEKPIKRKNNAS